MSKSSNLRIGNGQHAVAAAGTREPLVTGPAVEVEDVLSVTIKALSTNGGLIYVGDETVSNLVGFELDAGESVTLQCANVDEPKQRLNLARIYIDSTVNGEGVSFIYLKA